MDTVKQWLVHQGITRHGIFAAWGFAVLLYGKDAAFKVFVLHLLADCPSLVRQGLAAVVPAVLIYKSIHKEN